MIEMKEWDGFEGRLWKEEINVRQFIQDNYTPYDGDESFLADPTDATNKLWDALQKLQKEERAKGGVLDMETEVVGQSIGADSVKAGTTALFMAFILVALFMIATYRLSGILATIAMLINIILVIAVLSPLRFTLTLPGIAGLILTMGMAVDANIIIFERIKEELKI